MIPIMLVFMLLARQNLASIVVQAYSALFTFFSSLPFYITALRGLGAGGRGHGAWGRGQGAGGGRGVVRAVLPNHWLSMKSLPVLF